MREFNRPDGWVFEPHPRDDELRLVAIVEFWKPKFRLGGRVFVYAALIMTYALVGTMVIRCTPVVYRYLTSSPAPRSSAPQAIANPQHAVVEADRAPTVQVR